MEDITPILKAIEVSIQFAGDDRPLVQDELRLAGQYISAIHTDPTKRNESYSAHVADLLKDTAGAMDADGLVLLSAQVARAASMIEDDED